MAHFKQDGKLAPYMTRPSPPSFGQGFTSKGFLKCDGCVASDYMFNQTYPAWFFFP